jgi:dihydroneopterin aldolase
MDYLTLNNMQFYAYHGAYEQERKVGNIFIVDLKIGSDLTTECKSDKLEDAIDYASIFIEVKLLMQIPCNLLEHLAENICKQLKLKFSRIQTIEIKVTKLHPPILGQIESASVILNR